MWKIITKRGSRFKTGNGNRFKKTDLTVDVKKKKRRLQKKLTLNLIKVRYLPP